MPTHHHALNSGTLLHNVYRIQNVLQSGAFGITYLVVHVNLNSLWVIKEYLPEFATRRNRMVEAASSDKEDQFQWGLESFFNEAQTLHNLNHKNIVKVSDLFEENGTAYFVMPYIDGSSTLLNWFTKNHQPTIAQLQHIFLPLLDGLDYIHKQNLLHRDIKPTNILLTADDSPVLIDFGSARFMINSKKPFTQLLTPKFAPIEQYGTNGEEHTPAVDIYSLSVCLYQAITGKLPDAAPDRIYHDNLPKLAKNTHYTKIYTEKWLAAIDKGLSVQAHDRFQTAREMYNALSVTSNSMSNTTLNNNSQKTVHIYDETFPTYPKTTKEKDSHPVSSLKKDLHTLMIIMLLISMFIGVFFIGMLIFSQKYKTDEPYYDTVRLQIGNDMTTYTGWLKNGVAEDDTGTAKLEMDDGTQCVVSMSNNQRTGNGRCVFPQGSVYDGEWLNNKKHGFGTYTFSSTSSPVASYEGYFSHGKLHGKGSITYRSGAIFIGEFANNNIKTKSKGAITGMFHMPSLCEGTFTSNTANCVFRQGKSATKYIGEYKNGLCHGKGTVIIIHAGKETDRYYVKFRNGEIEEKRVIRKKHVQN